MTKSSNKEVNSLEKFNNSFFLSKASVCSVEHLKYCDCKKDLINKLYEKNKKKALELSKKICETQNIEFTMENPIVLMKLEDARFAAISSIGKYMSSIDERCPKEKEAISEVLSRFSVKRDLNDPEVFSIIESLINMKLNIVRYQRIADKDGIYTVRYDREGNASRVLSELEKLKLEYEKAVVDTITKLNKMVEGEKHVIANIDLTDNIKQVWEQRKAKIKDNRELQKKVSK